MAGENENTRNIINRLLGNLNEDENLNESRIIYDENHPERMLPSLEQRFRKREHSLGNNPAFPEGDERHFEEKVISKRYKDVITSAKRQFGVEELDNNTIMREMMGMVQSSMQIEGRHKRRLEELAIRMIREEFDMTEDDVEIEVTIVSHPMEINMNGTQQNSSPIELEEIEHESHADIENINKEVYKRRFLNAMIQGNAKKSSHMFHMVEDELTEMDPRLPSQYGKMMTAADYAYYMVDGIEDAVAGGLVKVEFPQNEGDKPKIIAKALVFPVLVHELCKGAMEILSSHGLPEDADVRKQVIGKADFLGAEPDDMRIGPGLWENFCNALPENGFGIKHHVYAEIAAMPADEFNETMREIQAGTNVGKAKLAEICDTINGEIAEDESNAALDQFGDIDLDEGPDDGTIDNPDDLDDLDIDELFS